MIYFWIFACIAFVAAEAATVSLVSIWFALGSAVALIAASLGAAVWLQFTLFILVSAVVLAFLRPVLRKYIKINRLPTNADRVIGKVCAVTEDIDNIAGTGAVLVDGKVWTARTGDGAKLPKGSFVKPVSIQGVKLIVEPAEKRAEETV